MTRVPAGRAELRALLRGSTIAFAARLASSAAALGCNVYVARLLGAELTGLYFLGFTLVTVGSVVGRLGLDNSVVRFGAAAAASGARGALRGMYIASQTAAVLASAVVAAILYAAAALISVQIFSKPGLEEALRIMAWAVIPTSFVMVSSNLFRALKRSVASVVAQSGLVPLLMLGMLVAIGARMALGAAALAYTIASVAAAVVCVVLWWRYTPGLRRVPPEFAPRELFRSSLPLYTASLMTLGTTWFPLFALGAWSSASDVGIFGAATRTAMLQSFVLIAINTVAGPRFAELAGARDMAGLRAASKEATRLALWSATPPAVVLIAGAAPIMRIFGPEFVAGAGMLVVLVVGQYINVLTGPAGQLLVMTGHERQVRNVRLATLVMNVALSCALIPRYGGIGAAFVASATVALNNVAAAWLARRVLRVEQLDPDARP
jgi:O-antigen/teichoic acid export membrane protein